jgi:two-component system invasion response regulator UvrY
MSSAPKARTDNVVTVLLVDDHAVVREGYRRILERTPDIEVVAEAGSGEDAYRCYCELDPDVVVMDLSMPGIGGIEAVRRIVTRDSKARVLIFSMYDDGVFSSRALKAGAKGYLTKASAPDSLVDAIRSVASGKLFLSPDVAQELAVLSLPGRANPMQTLSAREFEVFRLLVEGRSVAEISKILSLSQKTVANYQSTLRQKLEVANTTQAVRLAMAHGLFPPVGTAGDDSSHA